MPRTRQRPGAEQPKAIGITCGVGSMLLGARNAGFKVAGNVEWRCAGVYRITNLDTGSFYIGGAVNLHARFLHHNRRLTLGRHANPRLQFAWNADKELLFEVLLICRKEDVLMYEQRVLDRAFAEGQSIYNIVKDTAAPMAGVRFSDEHRARLSASLKKAYADRPGLASKRTKLAYKKNKSYRDRVSKGAARAHAERRGAL